MICTSCLNFAFHDEDDDEYMTVIMILSMIMIMFLNGDANARMMMMTLGNCILIMIVSREANCCGEHWACSSTGEIEERSQNSSEGT